MQNSRRVVELLAIFCYTVTIPLFPHQEWQNDNDRHKARVDEYGHIHIPLQKTDNTRPDTVQNTVRTSSQWEVTESDTYIQDVRKTAEQDTHIDAMIDVVKQVRGTIIHTTKEMVSEGKNQYVYSAHTFQSRLKDLWSSIRNWKGNVWKFLMQPVWVIQKNTKVKEYSRGSLFALDVLRFGGTFAAIFLALFVSLNYQSFFQIITPYINPVERVSSLQGNISEIDAALKDKLLKSPILATAGQQDGDLLSYLPTVGPPENRVIIPRIGLNVPLVTPSYGSLLNEDWEGVEQDIQNALEQGVVHYPGTARPGQAGNFFVTGHSSYYPWADGNYKSVFARLNELSIGDEYWVYYGGDKHRYSVTNKTEVKPTNVDVLDQPTNRRIATLMTCTPVGTTLRRLIITAQEIDNSTGLPLQVGEQEQRVIQEVIPPALSI